MTRLLIVSVLCLTLLDILMTHIGLRLGFVESNPVAAAVFARWGEAPFDLFKVVSMGVVLFACVRLPHTNLLLASIAMVLYAVVLNNVVRLLT